MRLGNSGVSYGSTLGSESTHREKCYRRDCMSDPCMSQSEMEPGYRGLEVGNKTLESLGMGNPDYNKLVAQGIT
jgi:hypothetical protein